METKFWRTEKVEKGTRILLKENLNNVPKTMIIYFKRLKVAGLYLYPLTSSLVKLSVDEKEFIDTQIDKYGYIMNLEEVDFTDHSIPYPVVGVIKVNFSKGIVIEFRRDKDVVKLVERMDKAVEELLTSK
ncbi:hypothetical protein D0U04_12195 [Bacillus clarus]|uniref:Uncharacterized protein n=1 Tax=Bacillus clarus TaxID=2338372 RepID=A0A090YTD1_9BACI|nr:MULTISPECIES: hypothetical protein [Bacillus]KFN01655.1 hypothetical protein DJ93_4645 [Bacillus clarus]MDM5186257.1 hypothetical protein [Bacillus sp. DX4.1]RFT66668.1 hypothetical protein D0U04_12195 [Bacillus clarus]